MVKGTLGWIARLLVIVGALNWGLAIWDINVVTMLLGSIPYAVGTVYALVGIAGLFEIYKLFK